MVDLEVIRKIVKEEIKPVENDVKKIYNILVRNSISVV
jgi:hypothetical protein